MTLAEMMAKEQDWVVIFNIKRIEEAVKKGDFKEISGVRVLDGRHGSPYILVRPVPNSRMVHTLMASISWPMASYRPLSYRLTLEA